MPLNFVEIEKPKEPVEFFKINTKTRPQQLHGEVLPELIRKVGDVKSGRIALWMIEQYLDKHVLIFDRELLKNIVEEADYRHEGSLDARALGAALTGRFPKHQYTKEWRQLVALILGQPDLVLTEDIVRPKVSKNGVFNAESFWTEPAPELPPLHRKRVKSAEPTGEWKTLSTTAAAALDATTTSAPTDVSGLGATTNFGATGPLGAVGDATLRTTAGIKAAAPIASEVAINTQGLLQGTGSVPSSTVEGTVPRSTFGAVKEFNSFSRGLEVASALGVDTATAAAIAASEGTAHGDSLDKLMMSSMSAGGNMASTSASQSGSWPWATGPKHSVRAYSSALPPTSITLPGSSLHTLRQSVRSTLRTKPGFETMHRTLGTSELDNKKVLGQGLDVSAALNRVEPVRPTHMKFEADYQKWSDYNNKCRTAPSAWYNEHPAVPAAAKAPTKYPW
eukprot:CAMPEP_0202903836 /NCGR_PEP_ID=MMETSP1392-20130828/26615_1 /ASSEMBLY_ACC=CAM_ASM_000868 /TAXON_ID=225041 /ORGANISM="Chlamydomonas chlamydogama, Strain SAG 11-48b" /LENGTH=449 /DNA_ID=CAMNT_0049591179 /DNA_START=180 /DNA_END=1526 /DNA_ORIENTATION=+